jgi:sugar lactone lactonase YvrE
VLRNKKTQHVLLLLLLSQLLLQTMRRTNGIDLSPDEKTLYLTEASTANDVRNCNVIWAYSVDIAAGTVWNKRLFADFGTLDGTAGQDSDGMRTDIQGESSYCCYCMFTAAVAIVCAHCCMQSHTVLGCCNGRFK